jgi:NADPH-dependent 7-cyano-7-deazaguanine reductase QueF
MQYTMNKIEIKFKIQSQNPIENSKLVNSFKITEDPQELCKKRILSSLPRRVIPERLNVRQEVA